MKLINLGTGTYYINPRRIISVYLDGKAVMVRDNVGTNILTSRKLKDLIKEINRNLK